MLRLSGPVTAFLLAWLKNFALATEAFDYFSPGPAARPH